MSECLGLSPRVRGNHASPSGIALSAGPIPACAGQPSSVLVMPFLARAYPRVCGAT